MDFGVAADTLAEYGSSYYERGWVYGTSGNFSARLSSGPFRACITSSGKEKGKLHRNDFLLIDEKGAVLEGEGNPSAETKLHLKVYEQGAGAVFHTHSVWGTLLADLYQDDGEIVIEGYEMLKGLSGVATHEHSERVPILENSQDYEHLSGEFEKLFSSGTKIHGIYLKRHGLYTWGKDTKEAHRHTEIFEALFESVGRRESILRSS